MDCPFRDSIDATLCMVLRITGEPSLVCAQDGAGRAQDAGYRCCAHYKTAIFGGLETVLRSVEKDGVSGALTRRSGT